MDLKKLKEASSKTERSQYGETGIIESIFHQLDLPLEFCLEFGSGEVGKNRGAKTSDIFTMSMKLNVYTLK